MGPTSLVSFPCIISYVCLRVIPTIAPRHWSGPLFFIRYFCQLSNVAKRCELDCYRPFTACTFVSALRKKLQDSASESTPNFCPGFFESLYHHNGSQNPHGLGKPCSSHFILFVCVVLCSSCLCVCAVWKCICLLNIAFVSMCAVLSVCVCL